MRKHRRFGWVKVLAVVLALPFGLSSCSDDTFDGNASDLYGTWRSEKYEVESIENGTVDAENSYEEEKYEEITLNSDGTMEYTSEYDGGRTILTFDGSWVLIGDVLTMHIMDLGCIPYTVHEVDKNSLVLTQKYGGESILTGITAEVIYTCTYKRIK